MTDKLTDAEFLRILAERDYSHHVNDDREIAYDNEGKTLLAIADRLEEQTLGVVSLELFGWKITNEDEPWSIEHLGNKFKAVDDEGKVKAAKTLQELITEIAEEQDDFRNRQEDALSKNIEAKEKAVEEYSKKFQQYHDACILKDKEIAELREAIRLYQLSLLFPDTGNPAGSLNADAQRKNLFDLIN